MTRAPRLDGRCRPPSCPRSRCGPAPSDRPGLRDRGSRPDRAPIPADGFRRADSTETIGSPWVDEAACGRSNPVMEGADRPADQVRSTRNDDDRPADGVGSTAAPDRRQPRRHRAGDPRRAGGSGDRVRHQARPEHGERPGRRLQRPRPRCRHGGPGGRVLVRDPDGDHRGRGRHPLFLEHRRIVLRRRARRVRPLPYLRPDAIVIAWLVADAPRASGLVERRTVPPPHRRFPTSSSSSTRRTAGSSSPTSPPPPSAGAGRAHRREADSVIPDLTEVGAAPDEPGTRRAMNVAA